MMHQICFDKLSAVLLDFVDGGSDGFLYLRMIGPEPTVNAIWARLMSNEARGKKWGSGVQIPIPGRSYPEYVAAQKGTYRTLRSRLSSGLIDLALIHSILTVAEDSPQGFYLLTYEEGVPAAFFARLNHSLALPLKAEWAAWLWQLGQQPQSRLTLETKTVYESGKSVEQEKLTETTEIPISRRSNLGTVGCFQVMCGGPYQDAWLQIIREHLALGIRLQVEASAKGIIHYAAGGWRVEPMPDPAAGWQVRQNDAVVASGPSLNYALTQVRERQGVRLILPLNP